jgi:hypothetical protein
MSMLHLTLLPDATSKESGKAALSSTPEANCPRYIGHWRDSSTCCPVQGTRVSISAAAINDRIVRISLSFWYGMKI